MNDLCNFVCVHINILIASKYGFQRSPTEFEIWRNEGQSHYSGISTILLFEVAHWVVLVSSFPLFSWWVFLGTVREGKRLLIKRYLSFRPYCGHLSLWALLIARHALNTLLMFAKHPVLWVPRSPGWSWKLTFPDSLAARVQVCGLYSINQVHLHVTLIGKWAVGERRRADFVIWQAQRQKRWAF